MTCIYGGWEKIICDVAGYGPAEGEDTMRSVFILTVSGEKFLFEADGMTRDQLAHIQGWLDERLQETPEVRAGSEGEICAWFQEELARGWGVMPPRVEVSYVLRIDR